MSKLIATLFATLFAATAFAQTGGVPPSQPPAGTAVTDKRDAAAATSTAPVSDKAAARKAKAKARHAKRDAKVGDKPLN